MRIKPKYIWIVELLAVFVVICLNCQHAAADQAPGWVSPTSVEQLVGGTFNISCTINKNITDKCTVQSLYFKARRANRIFKELSAIRIENDTTIVFTAQNVSQQHDEYLCKCHDQVINLVKVYVGTKPLKVKDFNCLGFDSYYMVCNFTAPSNSLITKYNVSFTTAKNYNYHYYVECNHDSMPVIICNITDEKYQKFDDIYTFRIDVSNNFGRDTQYFEINNFERMVLARPGQNLTVVNRTADSICLAWEMPRRSNYVKGVAWTVKVVPKGFEQLQRSMWRNHSATLTDTLCLDQLPYAGYDYALQVRVRNNIAKSLWSEPLRYTFYTASERPRRPPRVTPGGFYLYSSEPKVQLYWEQLEQHELNGDNFTYVISKFRKNGTLENVGHIQVESNSAVIPNWDKEAYHDIYVRSSNNVGDSLAASHMIIPPISDNDTRRRSPKNVRSVYHQSNSSYTLSWEAPEDVRGLNNYTVFWCNSMLGSECKGSIHFRNVSSAEHMFTTASVQTQTLNMAVSANFDRFNTGMHWLICSRDGTDDLGKLEPSIDRVTNSSLTVTWSTERGCPVILAGYNLTYCQRSDGKPDNCTTLQIRNRDAKLYTIRDLKPYTYYSVKMLMYSETKVSKYSDDCINRTGEAAPTQPRQLQFSNLTSSSVTLKWKPPLKANGVVRAYDGVYVHDNKTEYFQLPASTAELVDNDQLVYYQLTNLTAYTHYEVAIRARTLYSSEASNAVHFQTAVGVPSPPTLYVSPPKEQLITLEWTPPLKPAGRIDYYEVAVSEHNANNTLLSRRISYFMPRQHRTCVLATPKCTPLNRFEYQVRAVNVELLKDGGKVPLSGSGYAAAEDSRQHCEADIALSEAELSDLRMYNNSAEYRQHRSEWSLYGISCSPEAINMKGMMRTAEAIAAIVVIGLVVHYVYRKYRDMSNITCALPAGIVEGLKKPIDIGPLGMPDAPPGGAIVHDDASPQYTLQSSQHDFSSYVNESAKLLRSGGPMGGRCSESESAASYSYGETMEPPPTYMSMQHELLEHDNGGSKRQSDYSNVAEKNGPLAMTNGSGGYIKPTQMKNWSTPTNNANTLPSPNVPTAPAMEAAAMPPASGYVPVQIMQGRPAIVPSLPPVAADPPLSLLNASNYVQAADLHKFRPGAPVSAMPLASSPVIKPMANDFGYTAMEQLKRASMLKSLPAAVPTASPTHTNGTTATGQTRMQPPPIGGYVTPQELSALVHNRHGL